MRPPTSDLRPPTSVTVCSADSDLLPLLAHGVQIMKPENGGKFSFPTSADVCAKYQVSRVELLRDLKAIKGEDGDNIPGAAGLGPVRAAKLLATYGDLAGVLTAGASAKCKDSLKCAQARATVQLSYELVGLRTDAPAQPIHPKSCAYAH